MGSIGPAKVNFIDIRRDKTNGSLLHVLKQSLNPENGDVPSFPTLLLYDETGLKIFEEITYLDEYYLTNAEIETLINNADRIAARIPVNSRLLELGSGNLRKVDILLQAFEKARKPIEYYALDLSLNELERTFREIDTGKYQYVSLNALHGTYDDALSWLQSHTQTSQTTCVMSMGSSIGNFTREEAIKFLQGFKKSLGRADQMLIGLDACQDERRVFTAYNDSEGVTERFYRNGLDHANAVLGYSAFKQDEWKVEGHYDIDDHRHEASYVAVVDVDTPDFSFKEGQKLLLEYAYKYSHDQSDELFHSSGLVPQMTFGNKSNDYHLHLTSPSLIEFSVQPIEYASQPVPSLSDWKILWQAWDTVTKAMVPRDELMNKPIQLRNNLIFYLGHIPTFADIHYTKATGLKPTNPAYYYSIFERGIDPDVDNPEMCHDHSEIPDTWPPLDEILDYSIRVRSRILESIESGAAFKNRKLGRGLWLAYEHEAMHLETFLYMLLQSSRVLPPPGRAIPDFGAMALTALEQREENKWHQIPDTNLKIGLDDPENDLPPTRFFVWDNERPARSVNVGKFSAQSRPISNGEYAKFLEDTQNDTLPAGWVTKSSLETTSLNTSANKRNGNEAQFVGPQTASSDFVASKAVRTVYGPVPLGLALDWPIMASYNELAAYAKWADASIPSFEQTRTIYQYVEQQRRLQVQQTPSSLIAAVNGHLCNDGVEETPPSKRVQQHAVDGEASANLDSNDFFINLAGCNVGFTQWHPTAVTGDGQRLRGQGDTGGLWEWTSSELAKYEGFKAMDLYPGYTADFFDEKHNIILGGSWATVPRVAGRKTFVNWYQRNYPYTWATARLVRNVE